MIWGCTIASAVMPWTITPAAPLSSPSSYIACHGFFKGSSFAVLCGFAALNCRFSLCLVLNRYGLLPRGGDLFSLPAAACTAPALPPPTISLTICLFLLHTTGRVLLFNCDTRSRWAVPRDGICGGMHTRRGCGVRACATVATCREAGISVLSPSACDCLPFVPLAESAFGAAALRRGGVAPGAAACAA